MWEHAKKRAGENGVVFRLSLADIPEIPAVCPVLGIALAPNGKAGPAEGSPSLDRIRPDLGYVAGNVRVISHRANRIRGNATAAELLRVALDAQALETG